MIEYNEAEQQIIIALSWFRTRYALFLDLDINRKASLENIESFATVWMGDFKSDWTNIFDSLLQKGILSFQNGEYAFTAKGEALKSILASETPFFKYEYDHYFEIEKKSVVHAEFCKRVYGMDLSQHGLIDQYELSFLIDQLKSQNAQKILDVGCGNGKITEHLASLIPAHFLGIDISSEGIQLAIERTNDKENIKFGIGNLNKLDYKHEFDATLFLDTLYYADNLKVTLASAFNGLTDNGRIYAYFSQWIMDVAYSDNLLPDQTHLAKILKELNLNYTTINLTHSGIKHWKTKLDVLQEMKPMFIQEGSEVLWHYRYREAFRYANWADDKYTRYLYKIKK